MPTALFLGGAVVIAVALRWPSFTDSLWEDEIGTNYVVNGFGVGSVLHIVGTDQEGTPPLFFILAWLTKGFDGVEGIRLVSFVAGIAAIPLTYLLGLRTVGRPGAAIAVVIFALSPFETFYATEARAYALVMFLCLVATLTLLKALESGRFRWWLAYALSVSAGIYTHYDAVFVLFALFAWAFLAHPRARLPLLLANASAAILFAPWFPEFLEDSREPAAKLTEILHPLTLASVNDDLVKWAFGHPFIPTADLPGHPALAMAAAALLIGAAGLLLKLRGRPVGDWWPPPAGVALAVILALAVPLGALVGSLIGGSTIFTTRGLISSWPGLAVTLGGLVTAGRPRISFVATGLLLAAFAIGGLKMLDKGNQRPDLAGVVKFIERRGSPEAPVVDAPQLSPAPQTNLEVAFAPKGEPLPQRPILTLNRPTFATEIEARRRGIPILAPLPMPSPSEIARRAAGLAGHGKLFLVIWGTPTLGQLRILPGPVADFLAALPPRFHEVEFRTFPGPGIYTESVHVLDGSPAVG